MLGLANFFGQGSNNSNDLTTPANPASQTEDTSTSPAFDLTGPAPVVPPVTSEPEQPALEIQENLPEPAEALVLPPEEAGANEWSEFVKPDSVPISDSNTFSFSAPEENIVKEPEEFSPLPAMPEEEKSADPEPIEVIHPEHSEPHPVIDGSYPDQITSQVVSMLEDNNEQEQSAIDQEEQALGRHKVSLNQEREKLDTMRKEIDEHEKSMKVVEEEVKLRSEKLEARKSRLAKIKDDLTKSEL